MINKEVGTVIFAVFLVAHIGSIIYGFVKLIPNKQLPLGAKILFGVMFFGLPFVGPMAFHLVSKNWDTIMASKKNNNNSATNKSK
jgi:O-antigen/teichoic acid export membrane protein